MPFHLPDDTTDFVVSVRLTDSLGNVGSDSTYLIMFDYGDGVVTTTANVWKWELKGPAVTASRFGVYFAAKDTLGPTYQVSGTSGFTIGSYPVSHSVNISATTSSVSSYYEYSLPEYKRNPNGTRDPLWGRTFSPVWDDGTTDPAGQMRKASGEDPVDSTALTLTSVGVGPNRSLKYIASSIALGPVMSYYSVALTGTGEFASRQTGSGPGSPTPPYCDKTVQLDLFTLLSTYVRKHEGEVTGATSHFDFFKAQANGSAGQRTAQYLQRSWYRDWSPNPASVVSARLQGEIHKAGLSDHQSLDATLAANKNSIASCTWL